MFEHCIYPKNLPPAKLDELLSKGWFRMGQSIFTTHFTLFNNRIYRTIWLRHVLKDYYETKTIIQLKKRNKAFRVEIKNVEITQQHEMLFEQYKRSVYFNAASSVDHLLNGYVISPTQIYRTMEINLYDEDVLIACSYFDTGIKSAEGISAYYHPAYKSHSLGKYLIYLQIEYCVENNFEYFYPGYFVPGFAHLDYKLQIGSNCLEFLDPDQQIWESIAQYEDSGIPIQFQEYFQF